MAHACQFPLSVYCSSAGLHGTVFVLASGVGGHIPTHIHHCDKEIASGLSSPWMVWVQCTMSWGRSVILLGKGPILFHISHIQSSYCLPCHGMLKNALVRSAYIVCGVYIQSTVHCNSVFMVSSCILMPWWKKFWEEPGNKVIHNGDFPTEL